MEDVKIVSGFIVAKPAPDLVTYQQPEKAVGGEVDPEEAEKLIAKFTVASLDNKLDPLDG